MDTFKAVFSYTVREHLRRKAWLSAALFGLVLIVGGLLAASLAQDERARMMLDLGLAAIEAITLLTAVFLTVHLILSEVESRAVYLILSHPVRRRDYLLGRFAGTMFAVIATAAVMGLAHRGLMAAAGWPVDGSYALAWTFAMGQVAVMSALALLLSLTLTSQEAAMVFTAFAWMLGHFTAEMRFLAERAPSPLARALLEGAARAVPDLARLDYRDAIHGPAPGPRWIAAAALYALAYAAACLALSTQVFEQKEF